MSDSLVQEIQRETPFILTTHNGTNRDALFQINSRKAYYKGVNGLYTFTKISETKIHPDLEMNIDRDGNFPSSSLSNDEKEGEGEENIVAFIVKHTKKLAEDFKTSRDKDEILIPIDHDSYVNVRLRTGVLKPKSSSSPPSKEEMKDVVNKLENLSLSS